MALARGPWLVAEAVAQHGTEASPHAPGL